MNFPYNLRLLVLWLKIKFGTFSSSNWVNGNVHTCIMTVHTQNLSKRHFSKLCHKYIQWSNTESLLADNNPNSTSG